MNFKFSCIQLCVGLLGIAIISNAQELDQCPPKIAEVDKCSPEGIAELKKNFDDGIESVQQGYEKLNCKTEPPDGAHYDTCQKLTETACDIEDNKRVAVDDLIKTCESATKAAAKVEKAMAKFAALPPSVSYEMCFSTSVELRKASVDLELVFNEAINALEYVRIALQAAADTVGAIPVIGDAAKLAFLLSAAFVEVLKNVFINGIPDIQHGLAIAALDAGVCGKERAEYTRKLLEETYAFSEEVLETKVDRLQETVNETKETVNGSEAKIDVIDITVNKMETKIDIIDTNVDDNQLILEFLSCRFGGNGSDRMTTFVGGGCDGIDNDCDSNVLDTFGANRTAQSITIRVDECDEDLVPPTIDLARDPPDMFYSQEEAEAWFLENTIVSDDCVPSSRLRKSIENPRTTEQVTIKVVDTRCEQVEVVSESVNGGESRVVDGPGESSATRTFSFTIDGDAPTVTCGFYKPQAEDFAGGSLEPLGDHSDPLFIDFLKEKANLVNVKFWYQVQEVPANPGEKIDVKIVVTSNEYEHLHGRIMYDLIERRDLGRAPEPVRRVTLLLAPFTCRDDGVDSAKNSCLVEEYTTARFYDIHVVATDTSGNEGVATCTVVAVPEYANSRAKNAKKGGPRGGSRRNRALSPANGKDGEGRPRPTRNELMLELSSSSQRHLLKKHNVLWDTGLDESVVTPVPTPAPTPGKGKGGGKAKSKTKNPTKSKNTNKRS